MQADSVSKKKKTRLGILFFFTTNASNSTDQRRKPSAIPLPVVTASKAVYKTPPKTSARLHASFNLTRSLSHSLKTDE